MSIWLPITLISWIASVRSKPKLLVVLLLFSTLTGATIFSSAGFGFQPLYFITFVTMYLLVLNFLARKEGASSIPLSLITLFIFFAYCILVSFAGGHFNYGQFFYVCSIPLVTTLSYYSVKNLTADKVFEYIIKVSLIIFGYGIIDVILNFFGIPSLDKFFVNSSSVANNTWATAYGVPRATSVFPEPSFLGVYSAIIFLFCFSIMIMGKKIPLLKLVTLLSLVNLLLSASLSGFGVAAAGAGYLIAITIFSGSAKRVVKLLFNVVFMMFLSILSFFVFKAMLPGYVETIRLWILMRFRFTDDSTLVRTQSLYNGYEIGLENPFGVGLGNFISADLFSTISGAVGIVGFLFLALWFIAPILKSFKLAFSRQLGPENMPFFIILFSICVAFSTGLGHFNILWTWVFLGLSLRFINTK